MKKYKLDLSLIFFLIISLSLFIQCNSDKETADQPDFTFPEIDNIDSQVYDEMKLTCETYWDLSIMIDSTFEIIKDGEEYAIHCDGIIDGVLYQFVIRVDKEGRWINDGRAIKDQEN